MTAFPRTRLLASTAILALALSGGSGAWAQSEEASTDTGAPAAEEAATETSSDGAGPAVEATSEAVEEAVEEVVEEAAESASGAADAAEAPPPVSLVPTSALRAEIDALDDLITTLRDRADQGAGEIAGLRDALAERDATMGAYEADLAALRASLLTRDQELADAVALKDEMAARIEELTANLGDTDGLIATLEASLAEADKEIEAHAVARDELEALESQVAELIAERDALSAAANEAEAALATAEQSVTQGGTALRLITAERDSLVSQRTWLGVFLAIAILVAGYFGFRGKKAA